MEASPPVEQAKPAYRFGTFTGVFTPTLLTILGVIMYVRLPWAVGNAGLIGAFAILALALGITVCTGLSLSSIATNTRMGAGGPYAIISKSLGLEVGGSIGVPLYLSRPLGVAMYIFGFREGWLWLFPSHPALVVDIAVFALLVGISYKSADLAFRVQYAIMAIIALSLVSILLSPEARTTTFEMELFGTYPGDPDKGFPGTDFWGVFAVFFPATTGILAGANMSGDLEDPRRSIPRGTMAAIGISTLIYVGLAWFATQVGSPEDLASNYTIFIDKAAWGPAVLAGLLGATFSSALAGFVGGPRILMAMGQHRILPGSDFLARTADDGEPRNAIVVTGVLTFACLMMRDLNAIAPLVTMFFLITYFVINVVLLVERGLGLVSFRPTMQVHWAFPLLGAIGCIFTMFIVNPTFGLLSVAVVVGIYLWILRRGVESDEAGDVRSSILVALAEWAAARVTELSVPDVRAWKPNLLVPVEDPARLSGEFRLILDLCKPEGSVKLLGLATATDASELAPRVASLGHSFQDEGLFANWSIIDSVGLTTGTVTGLQALQSAFFRPNLVFLALPEVRDRYSEFEEIIRQARRTQVGVLLLAMHPRAGLGASNAVNLWIRAQSELDPTKAFRLQNLNLTMLMGYRLMRSWKARLNLITVLPEDGDVAAGRQYLEDLGELARIPEHAAKLVLRGDFDEAVRRAPVASLNVLGLQPKADFQFAERMLDLTKSSCLFVADSGRESALA